jgi:hypothetical protein
MLLSISQMTSVYGDPLPAGARGSRGGAQSVIFSSIFKDFLSMVFFMVFSARCNVEGSNTMRGKLA